MFTKDDLDTLMTATATPAVSLYMPTHVAGRPIRQDPIRLGNLLASAQEKLMEAGLRRPDVEALLAPARALQQDDLFWRHQQHGLAIFLAPGIFRHFRLPQPMPEEAQVGRRFHLRHLLPLMAEDGTFLVLTITASQVRFFEASRHGMIERDDLDLPKGIEHILEETDAANAQNASPVTRPRAGTPGGTPRTHNMGEDPKMMHMAQFIDYVRRIATRLRDRVGEFRMPLVVIAQPDLLGHFRTTADLSANLVVEDIHDNPDALDESELHRRAYDKVQPLFVQARQAALEHLRGLVGDNDPRGTTRIEDIVRAARFARVDKLLIAEGEHIWGRFDTDADKVQAHGSPDADDVDLLDEAAGFTLQQGGQVHIVTKDELPLGALAGAVLRY
jgi:hypothetical protein